MAKAKTKTKRVQPPPPAPPVADEPPAEPDEKLSRGWIVGLAAVVTGCAAATTLLLSGWTPGPSQPSPQAVAASAPPATTPAAAPAKPVTQKPSKPRARPKPKPPTPTQVSADLFAGECGICHTLAAVGTTGRVGPNLDDMKPTEGRVLAAIRNGGRGTGLMSPGMLTGQDAVRVAKFVAEASRR